MWIHIASFNTSHQNHMRWIFLNAHSMTLTPDLPSEDVPRRGAQGSTSLTNFPGSLQAAKCKNFLQSGTKPGTMATTHPSIMYSPFFPLFPTCTAYVKGNYLMLT